MADRQIQEAINTLSGGRNQDTVTMIECVVDSVDVGVRECSCTTIDGVKMTNVRLMSSVNDGFLIIPEVGSEIIVLHTKRFKPFICQFSSVDKVLIITGDTIFEIKDGKITFNDGSYDGLVRINDLTTKLNDMVQLMNVEFAKIQVGIVAGGGSYTPTNLQNFNKSDYENDKIIHGI